MQALTMQALADLPTRESTHCSRQAGRLPTREAGVRSKQAWEGRVCAQPHLDAKHALAKHDVANGAVNVLVDGETAGDHVAVLELHRLGTLRTELACKSLPTTSQPL